MDIKIFMCCHDKFQAVPPLSEPIQGGRAIHEHISGIYGDERGDNISNKNREYCELTVLYYAWKNEKHDYFGFCHYRRFFCFDTTSEKAYHVCGKITARIQEKMLGTPEKIEKICKEHNIIVPRAENMGITVREHYNSSLHHFSEDLDLFLELLSKKYPELIPFADEYLSQNCQYFCNMFIMDSFHFNEYCTYLFGILEEFDKKKNIHGSFHDDRTDGYLGERFLGIYILYCQSKGADIKTISRLDAYSPLKKRLFFYLFPPESKLRFMLKRIRKFIGGEFR